MSQSGDPGLNETGEGWVGIGSTRALLLVVVVLDDRLIVDLLIYSQLVQ